MAKLPILMYHHVALESSVGLTISLEKLERQFQFLKQNEYHSHHLIDVVSLQKFQNKKNIVITFDDAYLSQLEYAYPLLLKYHLKATFFVPLKYLGKTDQWNSPSSPIMTAEQLKSLDPEVIELAYHSFAHKKYDQLSLDEIEVDTKMARDIDTKNKLLLKPYLAYPYGKFPRKNPEKKQFFELLKSHGFGLGLRIGNRVNRFPFKKPFEVQRIDVKGEWELTKFSRMIRFGKILKL